MAKSILQNYTNAVSQGPAAGLNYLLKNPPVQMGQTPVSTGASRNGQVLAASTFQQPQQTQQSQQTNSLGDAQSLAEQAARDAYNAENQSLNTQFDYTAAQLNNQLGTLGNQRDQSLGQVDLGLQDVQNQASTSKTNLGTNTQTQINQAGSTARNVQGQNRNVLRSLGILNSSAAGQILAKPLNQFDEQRAQLGQFLVQKTTELDQFVNQAVKEASASKDAIVKNYNDLVNKIQTDLRFNDRSRNDALKQANAALSQRLSEIATSVMNYKQQADLQKQQYATTLGQITNIQQPSYDANAPGYQPLVNPGQQTQSAPIYQDPNKKKLGDLGNYNLGNTG